MNSQLKNELDYVPGIYKCYGGVDNLRLKARLEIIKSSMIPLSTLEKDSTVDPQYLEREELEFSWNEKILSSNEFELYKYEENCTSALEQEYHDKIEGLLSDGINNLSRRLFTYTSKDRIPDELHRNLFYDEDLNKSIFEKALPQPLSLQKLDLNETYESKSNLSGKNVVDYYPSKLQMKLNRSLSSHHEIMYIVADLSDRSEKSENKNAECMDYLLFTITWNKQTLTLSVTPDFASYNTVGYKIDLDKLSDTRYIYRYWLANISPTENQSSKNAEYINGQLLANQNLNFPIDFDFPRRNTQFIFYFLEIKKIEGFPGDNLFVQYFIHLPSNWTVENPEILYGITHQCRAKRSRNISVFSCIFEIKLHLNIIELNEESRSNPVNLPQLFFEVCSLDSWKRFRVEGYSWMPLPISSGCHKIILDSWRPVCYDRKNLLRRFFVGADCEIADVKYCGDLKCSSNLLARYGFDTMSSGRIHLVINAVQQTYSKTSKPKKMIYSLNSWKTSKLMDNVNNILEAFQKARRHMLSVREPISSSET